MLILVQLLCNSNIVDVHICVQPKVGKVKVGLILLVHCNIALQRIVQRSATQRITLQLQHAATATRCNTILQHTVAHYSAIQQITTTATHGNTLQHTATHRNTRLTHDHG